MSKRLRLFLHCEHLLWHARLCTTRCVVITSRNAVLCCSTVVRFKECQHRNPRYDAYLFVCSIFNFLPANTSARKAHLDSVIRASNYMDVLQRVHAVVTILYMRVYPYRPLVSSCRAKRIIHCPMGEISRRHGCFASSLRQDQCGTTRQLATNECSESSRTPLAPILVSEMGNAGIRRAKRRWNISLEALAHKAMEGGIPRYSCATRCEDYQCEQDAGAKKHFVHLKCQRLSDYSRKALVHLGHVVL